MVLLSVLSFTASILYLHTGLSTYKTNRRSELCKLFLILTLSLTIWSFADGFLYLAENVYEYSFWNKVSALGWCTFEALVLYITLILVQNKHIRLWYIKLLVILPAPVFLYMVIFLFGPDIHTAPLVEKIFYIGNFLYNFSYLAASIILLLLWGYKSKSAIQKRQAGVIVISSIIPFVLNLIMGVILPIFGLPSLPNMGQIFSLIMLWGVNYAITKYQFMTISPSLIANELFNELNGLTLLTDTRGMIMKANRQAYTLLGCKDIEIIGSFLGTYLKDDRIHQVIADCEALKESIRFYDINLTLKEGIFIPVNLSIIPLYSKSGLLQGLLVIGEDIRATKLLQNEIIRHKLTNERLHNSEQLFRTLLETTPIPILVVSKASGQIKYMNTQAIQLFGAYKKQMLECEIDDFFVNPEDVSFLEESLKEDKKPGKNEYLFKSRDGRQFIGILTLVSAIYQEEEVVLSCVIDMSEQKRVEETLKQNNENISKLNQELMEMNAMLANKSVRDSLTNLYNHQYMNELLENFLQQLSVSRGNLCIMMMDIDHFKNVNDSYGHMVGDKVLVTIAELIMKNTRKDDCIGRYGGEEFIVILPGATMEDSVSIAERIRESIQNYDFDIEGLHVTISIGIVKYLNETPNALVNKADVLLYQAKYNGRNRVEKEQGF